MFDHSLADSKLVSMLEKKQQSSKKLAGSGFTPEIFNYGSSHDVK